MACSRRLAASRRSRPPEPVGAEYDRSRARAARRDTIQRGTVARQSTLGEQVYAWVTARLGQQVGTGASWELAHYALRGVGLDHTAPAAESQVQVLGDWGVPIPLLEALPGDILELQDYEIRATTLHTAQFDDGTSSQRSEQSARTFAHHLAIVAGRPDQYGIAVIEQVSRAGGWRVEQRNCLLHDSAPIVTRAFQSVSDEAGRLRPATVLQHTSLRVTGCARVFRPHASRAATPCTHSTDPADTHQTPSVRRRPPHDTGARPRADESPSSPSATVTSAPST